MDINKVRPLGNNILIEVKLNEDVVFNGGKLYIDPSFNPQDHVSVYGTVIATPKKLYYDRKDVSNSMEWHTELDVVKGDVVYFDYFLALQALGLRGNAANEFPEPKYIEENGKLYIFLLYGEIWFRVRSGEITPLNGYSLCEGIMEGRTFQEPVLSKRYAKVINTGKPNIEYMNPDYTDATTEVGDVISFTKFANRRIEYPLHSTMGEMYAIQGRYIQYKLLN